MAAPLKARNLFRRYLIMNSVSAAPQRILENEIKGRKRAEESLRENEQFLSAVFDSIQDGICVLDSSMNILRANQKVRDFYAHVTPLEGKRCHEVFYRRAKPCDVCPVLLAMKSGRLEKKVLPFKTRKGTDTLLEVFAFPMLDDSGQPSGVVEYIRDITEHKKAEAAMLESERMRGVLEMAGAVCHEMNQPLTAISGFSELISLHLSEEDPFYDHLSKLSEQVLRLGGITRKLSNLTKYETKTYLKSKIVDIERSSRENNRT
jgi:PAS domain S-box-containing protein